MEVVVGPGGAAETSSRAKRPRVGVGWRVRAWERVKGMAMNRDLVLIRVKNFILKNQYLEDVD